MAFPSASVCVFVSVLTVVVVAVEGYFSNEWHEASCRVVITSWVAATYYLADIPIQSSWTLNHEEIH